MAAAATPHRDHGLRGRATALGGPEGLAHPGDRLLSHACRGRARPDRTRVCRRRGLRVGAGGVECRSHPTRTIGMTVEVKVPRLAESVSDAVLVEGLKDDGTVGRTDEPIATLETDKAAGE